MKNNSSLAAHFAKRNTKNCGGEKRSGESEGGQKFLMILLLLEDIYIF